MNFSRLFKLIGARNKEFYRDRSALAWNIIFPVLVIFGFYFAFSGKNQELYKVAVLNMNSPAAVQSEFLKTQYTQFINETDEAGTLAKLKRHSLDMVVDFGTPHRYWINPSSPKGYFLEKLLLGDAALSAGKTTAFQKNTADGAEIRYVDWLISGLLAMNIMFSALFGVGYTIVRYRKNGVLKRFRATPISAFEFLFAQLLSRMIILVIMSAAVYAGCNALIHFQMLGSYLNLALILVLGSACLMSLGLMMAARTASEEFAGGALNLISWPMMFLSGVWFSLEGAPKWLQMGAQVFPLTHIIGASRAIMTEGAALSDVMTNVTVLGVMTAVFLTVGSLTFKWK